MSFRDWLQPVATATPATTATGTLPAGPTVAEVATVAVATRPDAELETDCEGWRPAEAQAIEAWHLHWRPVWESWQAELAVNPAWGPPPPFESRCRVAELVAAWNCCTGQHRTPEEVCRWLSAEDFTDRELMQPGALALFVWTCFADGGR